VDLISPSASLGASTASVSASAGSGSVSLAVTPAGAPWSAYSDVPWLILTASSGTGSGSIGYSYAGNPSTNPRTGVIVVMGQTLTVIQAGATGVAASVTISPSAAQAFSTAGQTTFQLTVNPAAAWMVTSTASWLTVSSSSGSASTTLSVSWTTNTSAAARTAAINIANATFTVLQLGTTGAHTQWGSTFYGEITTIAGGGSGSNPGDGGPAVIASLGIGINSFTETAVDSNGNLFIATPTDHRVRRVDAVTGIITTVAGTGTQGFSGDLEPATSATLNSPTGVTADSAGNLYIGTPAITRFSAWMPSPASSPPWQVTEPHRSAATAARHRAPALRTPSALRLIQPAIS